MAVAGKHKAARLVFTATAPDATTLATTFVVASLVSAFAVSFVAVFAATFAPVTIAVD